MDTSYYRIPVMWVAPECYSTWVITFQIATKTWALDWGCWVSHPDALIAYQKLHEVRLRDQETVADLQESVRLSNLRYSGGTTTYPDQLFGSELERHPS